MRSLFLLLALLTASCASVPQHRETADPAANAIDHLPSLAGGYFPVDSSATGRRYHVYVRLPQGYDPNAATRYPVVSTSWTATPCSRFSPRRICS